jgi:hypothetical protein
LSLIPAHGCSEFDATRRPAPRGTLGEEIVRVFCERMASEVEIARPEGEVRDVSGERWKPVCRGEVAPPADAPRRLVVLMENRTRLAEALDQTLPEGIHDELGAFLGDLMPMFDPPRERLPQATRLLSDFLAVLSADDDALDAMSRLGTRSGYRPLRLGLGVVRPLLAYPEIDTFVDLALRTLTDLPDDATDGLAADEFRAVHTALAMEMAGIEPAEPLLPGERSTLDLTRELMFTSDARFGGTTTPRWVLVRDDRALALPRGGAVAAPFVDGDGDGLADVDALGRFIETGGGLLDVPPPFAIFGESGIARDGSGRAISSTAVPFYEYVDADETLGAAVVREALPWFDRDAPTLLQLSRGLPELLGATVDRTATYGGTSIDYTGWNTERSSAIDMVYALSELMPRDRTDDVLRMLELLIEDHESAAAGVVHSGHYMLTRSDLYPDARLRQPNSLWDDLIELAIRIDRRPGMLEALLRSFSDPRSALLGDLYGRMMRFRDPISYNPADPNGAATGLPMDVMVDRSMDDVEGNESLFERSIALIDGLNGVRVCNRAGARLNIDLGIINLRYPLIGTAGECDLINIPNVAEAYALAILGRYELEIQDGFLNAMLTVATALGINVDDVLERSSGIEGLTTHPTPQALNRLVFWALGDDGTGRCTPTASDHNCNSEFAAQVFDRIRDRHGNDVIDTYDGTIFAWEQPGFYDGMTPMLEVLHDPRFRNDAEGNYAFGNIIETIWSHWPTANHWVRQSTDPTAPNYVPGDNGRSYELLVADGFVEGRFLANLQSASAALDGLDMGGGEDGIDVLSDVASELLNPDRSPGLTTRDGRTTIPRNDGGGMMAITPMQLVLDALRNVDRDLSDADPDVVAEWRTARDGLTTQFLDTRTVGAGYAFQNQRGRAVVLTILPFLRARLEDHRTRGDLDAWAEGLPTDLSDFLNEPLVAGLIQMLDVVNGDPEARGALVDLVGYLVDEASDNDAFLAVVYALMDMLQVMEDDTNIVPLLHAMSGAMSPNARALVGGATGTPEIESSVGYDALPLLREIRGLDRTRMLRQLLNNLVVLRADETTPLETILDVMSEVNRSEPGAGGSYLPEDYRANFGEMTGFMDDERRGMERLYDVVQARELVE